MVIRINEAVALAVHDEQLAEHGGASGVRDLALLSSALARPQHLIAYRDGVDLADLAAAYGYGLMRNHPFVDGNKRVALVVLELFLALNGLRLDAGDADCVEALVETAAGSKSETEFANWIRDHSVVRRRR